MSNLYAVSEGEADTAVSVNRCMIQKLAPRFRVEHHHLLRQTTQCAGELLRSGLGGYYVSDLPGYLVMLSFDAIVPGNQIIVSFLVFRLGKGNVGVFVDCRLYRLCQYCELLKNGRIAISGEAILVAVSDIVVHL